MNSKIKARLFAFTAATLFAFTSCGGNAAQGGVSSEESYEQQSTQSEEQSAVKDVPAEIAMTITNSGSCTIDKETTGTVVIDTEGALKLTLKNAVIKGTTGPALYVKNCKGLEIVLEGESTLSDSGEYSVEQGELKAALFSEDDITISGSGSVTVTGNRIHAIASDDGIVIESGSLTVESAVKDGIHANDLVEVKGGTLAVKAAGGDAVESEAVVKISGGNIELSSTGDGIKAALSDKGTPSVSVSGGSVKINTKEDGIQSDGTLDITGGDVDITTTGVVSGNNGSEQMPGGGFRPGGGNRPTRPDGGNRYPGFNPDVSMEMPDGGMVAPPDGGMAQINTVTTTTNEASSKGIKASGALTISGGDLTVNSTDDAVHSNGDVSVSGGTLTLKSGDDGIHADGALVISNGNVTVSQSYEALEGKSVDIEDGVLSLTASDDGINATSGDGGFNRPGNANADNKININGGNVYVNAGGDGVDSNGTLTVNGGFLCVEGSGNGNSAIDADGTRLINGGVVVALSSGDMMENPQESSKQNCAVLMVNTGLTAGTTAALTDSKGNVVFCYSIAKSSRALTISLPELKSGESYTLYTGVTPQGGKTCGGLYYGEGVSFTGGTVAKTFTQSSTVTQAR